MNSIPARRENSRLGSVRRASAFPNFRVEHPSTSSSGASSSNANYNNSTAAAAVSANDKASRAEIHVSVRLSGSPISLFAVVYDERRRTLRSKTRAEVGRTETILTAGDSSRRSFLRSFLVRSARNPNLRVALFEYIKNGLEHVFLGAVSFALNNILENGLVTKTLSDGEASNNIEITLGALQVDNELFTARRSIAIRMVVPEMRRRKFPNQLVTQSFDISRRCSSSNGTESWVPIYRSEALAAPSASSPHERHVRFHAATIPEWRLYGIETALRIRYNHHSIRYKGVHVAAVCYTSLSELQILDPSRDFLPLYGDKDDATCVGRLFLTQAEPTKSGGVFSLTVQYHQFSLSNTTKRALSKSAAAFRRHPDDTSFGGLGGIGVATGDSSFGTAPSLDRFALKFRKKVLSDNGPPQWTPASARDLGTQTNRVDDNDAHVPRRTPRWRTWLNT